MIADMVMKTEAARILTYKACVAQMNKDKKPDYIPPCQSVLHRIQQWK